MGRAILGYGRCSDKRRAFENFGFILQTRVYRFGPNFSRQKGEAGCGHVAEAEELLEILASLAIIQENGQEEGTEDEAAGENL